MSAVLKSFPRPSAASPNGSGPRWSASGALERTRRRRRRRARPHQCPQPAPDETVVRSADWPPRARPRGRRRRRRRPGCDRSRHRRCARARVGAPEAAALGTPGSPSPTLAGAACASPSDRVLANRSFRARAGRRIRTSSTPPRCPAARPAVCWVDGEGRLLGVTSIRLTATSSWPSRPTRTRAASRPPAAGEEIKRPTLGIAVAPPYGTQAAPVRRPARPGRRARARRQGRLPADRAGVERGDLIVEGGGASLSRASTTSRPSTRHRRPRPEDRAGAEESERTLTLDA
jgi:hypothetical protein